MTAELLPFPIVRRRELIKRIADQMLARSPRLAEAHLAAQIRRQTSAMRRRQLDESAITEQMRAFEGAVRATLWLLILKPPPSGAA